MKMARKHRSRFRIGCLLLAAGTFLAASLPFAFARNFLVIDSGPSHADALIILGGESIPRAARAVQLFQTGAAPKIIVSGDSDAGVTEQLLLRAGVPAAAIELEDRSRNTKENAEFTTRLLNRLGIRRAIIVTSWFHSRRALHSFRHFAPGVQFFSEPAFYPEPWQVNAVHVSQEYLKTGFYAVRYGILPW